LSKGKSLLVTTTKHVFFLFIGTVSLQLKAYQCSGLDQNCFLLMKKKVLEQNKYKKMSSL